MHSGNTREKIHSGKRGFPECFIVHGTRGREALREDERHSRTKSDGKMEIF
jgi:hypothetical protein